MSQGVCFCPCVKNGHAPGVCTGQADDSRPRKPSLLGRVELPVCAPCSGATDAAHEAPLLAPDDPNHSPDMPAQTAAQLRSFTAGHLKAPRPPSPS